MAGMAAMAASLAAPIAPAAPPAAQQGRTNWTRVIAVTPEGGFRMGNPDAPLKLVEFVSLTCPHCATFAAEAIPPLIRDHVASGRVSLEYRNFVLNPLDLVAAAISRCAAPRDYFALTDAILGSQDQWVGRLQALPEAERQQLSTLAPGQLIGSLASLSGLEALAARHGLAPAAARACLADETRLERLAEMRRAAEAGLGVEGTPSFALNGRLLGGVHDWGALEPLLRPPGR